MKAPVNLGKSEGSEAAAANHFKTQKVWVKKDFFL